MKFYLIDEKEITDLEIELGIELIVRERQEVGSTRFYVIFENTDVLSDDRHFLIGSYGNGSTIDEAIYNYAKEIENKTVVFDAWGEKRREIKLTKLKHTKLLNK